MTRETSIQVLGTGALCAALLNSACRSTRHDEPASVPAATIVPSSFIIGRDGRIAWIGHPMHMEGPLAEVLKAN